MRNFNREELTVLSAEFESQPPTKILEWVGESFQIGEVGMATGFGAEGVALIDMIASINKNIPIFFLDTDVLFPELTRCETSSRKNIRYILSDTRLTFLSNDNLNFMDQIFGRPIRTFAAISGKSNLFAKH